MPPSWTISRATPIRIAGLAIMPQRSSFYLDYHLYRMYQTDATHANAAQRSGYSNPEVDTLLKQEESDFDPAHRLTTFQQAQKLIWDDQPFVYLFQQTSFWGQQKNVSGFIVPPTGDFIRRSNCRRDDTRGHGMVGWSRLRHRDHSEGVV